MNIYISKTGNFIERIKQLDKNLSVLNQNLQTCDLSEIQWITPFSILPVSYKLSKIQNIKMPENCDVKNYLDTIFFPQGSQLLSGDRFKTYLPIMKLNSDYFDQKLLEGIDNYETLILDKLIKEQIFRNHITNALKYFLGELFTNYQEHSKGNEFRILSQFYPKSDELEICLLDNGIGIMESYKNAKVPISVIDDAEAISKAVNGISAKKGFGSEERGFGLRTSINLICNSELRGEFVLISGSAGYYSSHQISPIIFRMESFWQGVIVAMRIYKPVTQIDIYDFIE